ncbi:MAG: hypothetical protein G3M78_03180 [Candidatus Nitrohelix vancouverensis]|uniref:Uncharacterized protein n=1 Tax=Candidatus Nitrohelix vancouverensis TaxID=2705534 RepID=A0A7T0C0S8_9BACT|nr:MAG: hypothetical protein G3M78_03180 [Candidatus Nitrohelix vancouverensis]
MNTTNFKNRLSQIIDPDPMEVGVQETGESVIDDFRGTLAGRDTSAAGVFINLASFNDLQRQALTDNSQQSIHLYVDAGIALSNELCTNWFRELGKAQAMNTADRNILSNVGALTATMMGIFGAGATSIAGVAGATGFAETLYTSEMANFIVAPDISEVQEAINLERANRVVELKQSLAGKDYNYYEARSELIRYDNSCSHLAVKRFVKTSLDNASEGLALQFKLATGTPEEEMLLAEMNQIKAQKRFQLLTEKGRDSVFKIRSDRITTNTARDLSALLGKTISPQQIYPLYAMLTIENEQFSLNGLKKIAATLNNLADREGQINFTDSEKLKIMEILNKLNEETEKSLEKRAKIYIKTNLEKAAEALSALASKTPELQALQKLNQHPLKIAPLYALVTGMDKISTRGMLKMNSALSEIFQDAEKSYKDLSKETKQKLNQVFEGLDAETKSELQKLAKPYLSQLKPEHQLARERKNQETLTLVANKLNEILQSKNISDLKISPSQVVALYAKIVINPQEKRHKNNIDQALESLKINGKYPEIIGDPTKKPAFKDFLGNTEHKDFLELQSIQFDYITDTSFNNIVSDINTLLAPFKSEGKYKNLELKPKHVLPLYALLFKTDSISKQGAKEIQDALISLEDESGMYSWMALESKISAGQKMKLLNAIKDIYETENMKSKHYLSRGIEIYLK